MAETTDEVLRRRRSLQISFLVGWVAWYGFFILLESGIGYRLPAAAELVAALIGAAGWFVFAFSLFRIITLRKRYRDDPGALAALNDDLMKHQRGRAMITGLYAVLGVQVVLAILSRDLNWSAELGAHFSIFVCVGVIFMAGLWIEREGDPSGE